MAVVAALELGSVVVPDACQATETAFEWGNIPWSLDVSWRQKGRRFDSHHTHIQSSSKKSKGALQRVVVRHRTRRTLGRMGRIAMGRQIPWFEVCLVCVVTGIYM